MSSAITSEWLTLTNKSTRDLKVGFDVHQLVITAAQALCFGLGGVWSSCYDLISIKSTSTHCAKTSLFWTYFQSIHEECHLFHEMRTNLLKHFELVPCGSFRRTRVLTVQLLGCNCSWFWLEFYHRSNVLFSGNPNLHLYNKIKWLCILLGFLKSGFIPHLPYQTHCPPVEALALKRNIVNLFFWLSGLDEASP